MPRFARRIHASVQFELDEADRAMARDAPDSAFRHLERAHVLGQAATVEHVRVHARMFRWAVARRKPVEALGQLWRLAAAALKTPLGWLPEGNTGGSNVSGLRRMPVPADLQRILDDARR